MSDPTLSPTAKDALARLLTNERRGTLTHRSAFHQSTREGLIGRGLIYWKTVRADGRASFTDHLCLTDDGRAVAERLASKTWVGGVKG